MAVTAHAEVTVCYMEASTAHIDPATSFIASATSFAEAAASDIVATTAHIAVSRACIVTTTSETVAEIACIAVTVVRTWMEAAHAPPFKPVALTSRKKQCSFFKIDFFWRNYAPSVGKGTTLLKEFISMRLMRHNYESWQRAQTKGVLIQKK